MVKINSKSLNLRVAAAILIRWKARARAENRTLTNLIEFVLEDYCRACERKEARRDRESK